jgi:hypothetical protein
MGLRLNGIFDAAESRAPRDVTGQRATSDL